MLAPLLFVFLSQVLLSSAKLPKPVKLCKNDDSFNDCVIKQSHDVIQASINGIPKYGIPAFDPLHIDKIEQFEGGSKSITMNLTMEDINVYGLGQAELVHAEHNTPEKYLKLTFHFPHCKFISKYDLVGKFLVIPVTGKGKATMTLDDVTTDFIYHYKLIDKNGSKYVTSVPPVHFTTEPKNASINFENLFNGNKALGDAANKMMTENWREFKRQMGKGFEEAIGGMANIMLDRIVGHTPYSELFLK
ncbi:unnamed protein product [Nezara viridula]|uniref:Uncharacterized protein n=1 Tax=Nezara viridula TaxID=85310 RepID=A0A9P0H3M2_NEZVI|nr:unnamed protein product [Nezara viridula]